MATLDWKIRLGGLAWIWGVAVLGVAAPGRAAPPAPDAIPIAVLNLDYDDRSGEVGDQTQQHAARLTRFADTLQQGLAASGRYRIVSPTCDPAPCTAVGTDPDALVAAVRKAGGRLMMFGGVHKMSTLIEYAKLLVIDVQSNKVVFDKLISFRGDDDEAWNRAASFTVQEFLTPPAR
jgi:hypothetical protein